MSADLNVYLLQRRGVTESGVKAMIVVAETEAHARVLVCGWTHDNTWGDNGRTSCQPITTDKTRSWSIYA